MSKYEEAISEGNKLVSLNTRIRENVSMEIENTRLLFQMFTNVSKVSKQAIIEKIILRGCESICEEINAEYRKMNTNESKSEIEPEDIEIIPEEMQSIVSKSEEPEKKQDFMKNGDYTREYYENLTGEKFKRQIDYDEVNEKRNEKLQSIENVGEYIKQRRVIK